MSKSLSRCPATLLFGLNSPYHVAGKGEGLTLIAEPTSGEGLTGLSDPYPFFPTPPTT